MHAIIKNEKRLPVLQIDYTSKQKKAPCVNIDSTMTNVRETQFSFCRFVFSNYYTTTKYNLPLQHEAPGVRYY